MVSFDYKLKGTSSNELFFTITAMYASRGLIHIDSVSVKVSDSYSLGHGFKHKA